MENQTEKQIENAARLKRRIDGYKAAKAICELIHDQAGGNDAINIRMMELASEIENDAAVLLAMVVTDISDQNKETDHVET